MENKFDESYIYKSEYVSLDDFCHELQCAFKDLFICDLQRKDNTFVVTFADNNSFKLTVEQVKED